MDKDILTTSDTAKLLGVSVRTAQLLIEGGTLTSWKTPGGHRRVYRSDVMTMMAQKPAPAVARSARVVIIAGPEQQSEITQSLAAIGGIALTIHANGYAAAAAIGQRRPAAIVIDAGHPTTNLAELLQFLATSPGLSQTKVIVVGGGGAVDIATTKVRAPVRIESSRQLADIVRQIVQSDNAETAYLVDDTSFPVAPNEPQRLAALAQSGLRDAGPEEAFDQLVWLAGRCLDTPIALMTLLTSDQQVFKARLGVDVPETPRSWAFCNYTILQREPFIVGDLSGDARFTSNPAVAGDLHFRFYAGAPITDPDGFALGSLCVIDRKPRTLDAEQEQTLSILAKLASDEVSLRAAQRLAAAG